MLGRNGLTESLRTFTNNKIYPIARKEKLEKVWKKFVSLISDFTTKTHGNS